MIDFKLVNACEFWAALLWMHASYMQFWPAAKGVMVSKGEEKQRIIEDLQEQLKTLESELKEKKFFGGESVGYLDIAANVIVWLAVGQEAVGMQILTEEKHPVLLEWHQRVLEDAVFKECVPPREKHLGQLKVKFGSPPTSAWRSVGLCLWMHACVLFQSRWNC